MIPLIITRSVMMLPMADELSSQSRAVVREPVNHAVQDDAVFLPGHHVAHLHADGLCSPSRSHAGPLTMRAHAPIGPVLEGPVDPILRVDPALHLTSSNTRSDAVPVDCDIEALHRVDDRLHRGRNEKLRKVRPEQDLVLMASKWALSLRW